MNACRLAAALVMCAAASTSCETPGLEPVGPVTPMESPAGPASGQPFLSVAADGSVLMSWLEEAATGHALRHARLRNGTWSEPGTLAESASLFVNWADFPSIIELSDGRLAAHWLARSGPGTYAYDVLVSVSDRDGLEWSEPVRPHRDGTETEHGFVTLFEHRGDLAAVWLDGRKFADSVVTGRPATNEMTVRFTTLGAIERQEEQLIDDRSCDCCQTDVAVTADGPVVVYRDRTEGEIRDIVVSRFRDGLWSEPSTVHADGWEIEGCPVNGPAMAASAKDVVVAWFTAAHDSARVFVAFSDDDAASFGAPVRVDAGNPLGRVDAVLLEDGTAVVTWIERAPSGARVLSRRVAEDGSISTIVEVGGTSDGRPSGFPRMVRSGGNLLFAWTVPGEVATIRMATAPVPEH